MSSRNMSLLPRATLHSDSEQFCLAYAYKINMCSCELISILCEKYFFVVIGDWHNED